MWIAFMRKEQNKQRKKKSRRRTAKRALHCHHCYGIKTAYTRMCSLAAWAHAADFLSAHADHIILRKYYNTNVRHNMAILRPSSHALTHDHPVPAPFIFIDDDGSGNDGRHIESIYLANAIMHCPNVTLAAMRLSPAIAQLQEKTH